MNSIFGASWITKLTGWIALIPAFGVLVETFGTYLIASTDNNPNTIPSPEKLALAWASFVTALGLIFTRQNNVSSEAVQATGTKVAGK